jgi:hypothetical protein
LISSGGLVRKSIGWIGVLVATTGLVALVAQPAGAGREGSAPLHVRKVVVGPVPPGTQFVETVACEGEPGQPIIFTPSGAVASQQLVFDAQGNPVGTGDTVTFISSGECTVTESQTGGAASVTYQCEGSVPPPQMDETILPNGAGRFSPRLAGLQLQPCQTSGPQSEPIGVNIVSSQQEATVTVTNTFVDPGSTAAAVPVQAVPLFTG